MRFVKQKQGLGTCGAVAYAAITEVSELQGIRDCKTIMKGKGSGTFTHNVRQALHARGIDSHYVNEGGRIDSMFWLESLSLHFPMYAVVKAGRGSGHAIAIAEGMVWDGHNDGPVPLTLYGDSKLDFLLVVEKELDSYGKGE